MFIKHIKKHKSEIASFVFAYEILHPEEIAPSYEMLVEISKDADKIFLGSYNICFFKKFNDETYEAIAYWCIASKKLPNIENKKCFLENRKMFRSLDKKVIITNLQEKYKDAAEKFNDTYYLMKMSK
jgi:hypothetical protein